MPIFSDQKYRNLFSFVCRNLSFQAHLQCDHYQSSSKMRSCEEKKPLEWEENGGESDLIVDSTYLTCIDSSTFQEG